MTDQNFQQLATHTNYLKSRRDAILLACRAAAQADPEQTTVDSLTRAQLNDHLPQVLDAFERKLSARQGSGQEIAADAAKNRRR